MKKISIRLVVLTVIVLFAFTAFAQTPPPAPTPAPDPSLQAWGILAGIVTGSIAILDALIKKWITALLWQNLVIALVGAVLGVAAGGITQLSQGATFATAESYFLVTVGITVLAVIENWIQSVVTSSAAGQKK